MASWINQKMDSILLSLTEIMHEILLSSKYIDGSISPYNYIDEFIFGVSQIKLTEIHEYFMKGKYYKQKILDRCFYLYIYIYINELVSGSNYSISIDIVKDKFYKNIASYGLSSKVYNISIRAFTVLTEKKSKMEFIGGKSKILCKLCVGEKNFSLINWLKSQKVDVSRAASYAAGLGDLNLLKYFIGEGYKLIYCYENAAKYGHIHILEYLKRNCKRNNSKAEELGKKNRDELTKYLGQTAIRTGREIEIAAKYGQFKSLKWLIQNNFRLDYRAAVQAIEGKQYDIFKWLIMNGCPINCRAYHALIEKNNLDLLKWLYDNYGNSSHLEVSLYSFAISFGKDTNILVWLKEQKCPMDTDLYRTAIDAEKNDAFKWLLENGCPITQEIIKYKVKKDTMRLLEKYEKEDINNTFKHHLKNDTITYDVINLETKNDLMNIIDKYK